MNPAHREAWPPSQGPPPAGAPQTEQVPGQTGRPIGAFGPSNNQNANPQPSAQASPSQGPAHVLPPPSGGPFYSSAAASAHNQSLPALSAMGGPSPQPPTHQAAQRPASSESGPTAMSAQGTLQAPSFSLPGISQTLQQPQMQSSEQAARERELHEAREREMHAAQQRASHEEEMKRQAEQRDREIHEQRQQQQQEIAARENHAGPIQIHQPVAVAPSTRSIHGPNGLLGQPGPLGAPPGPLGGPLGGPNAPAGMFGNAPGQPGDTTPRMQHAVQPPHQASMLVPFGGPPGAPMAMGQGQQPILNDALSYLDQVKVQFADHPDVYNRFLDIMKDFKSGAIDTPGVIERVSSLFAGNPDLIQGFNTFLPPGYKIECGTNGDPNNIRVTTPMGTMVSTIPSARPLSPPRSAAVNGGAPQVNESPYYDGAHNRQWQQARPEGQEGVFSPDNRAHGLSLFAAQQGRPGQAPLSPEVTHRQHPDAVSAAALAHQQEQRGVSQLQNAVSAATGRSILSPSGDPAALVGQPLTSAAQGGQLPGMGEKRGPVEFNHAISYVNKIKNRFAQQPDIYKQFLEILQTYQRESKPIQDVYAQVTSLFSTAPDLLEDFKQFLPESAAQHRAQQQAARHAEGAAMLDSVRGEPAYAQAPPHQQTPRADTSRLPPMGNFAPTPTANRDNKRKRGDRQGPGPAAAPMPTPMQQEIQTSSLRGYGGPGNVNKRAKTGHPPKQPIVPEGPPISPTLTPALPVPLPPSTTTTPTQDELAFFDRVKKFLANKNAMNEFLKLINLFSQDLIDKQLLIFRAQAFIGGNQELFNWFKNFVGGDEDEAKHPRVKTVNSRVSLSNCRSFGPSYRLLPKRERERTCSGRDELCRSVLNDEWASHPTWASEDSGFVAHRKNTFEEGLHRIEEERHDYDFNIEACARTIQQLEPIAQQLYSLKGEDRLNFTVPPGLGGQSQTIYKRVIMKIYGREKGAQVTKELFNTPWSVVPILLHRLKSKLEDWKAAQREWEKVWREQTQKIFWRSLDHQSLSVKQNDKRQFQPKSLLNEIQVRYEEQKRLQEIQEIQQPDHQFAYSFRDEEVLYDIAKLMLTYADNNTGSDFSRVVPFIKEFIPLFFGLDASKFEQRVQNYGHRESSTNESADEMASPDEDVSQRSQKLKKGDLRRGVLDPRGKRKEKEDSLASASRDTTPDVASAAEEDTGADSSNSPGSGPGSFRWIHLSDKPELFGDRSLEHDEPYSRTMYNFYANSSIYCFFRMFVYLYERLSRLKEYESTVRSTIQCAKKHKPANDLKMIDKTPDDFFRDTSESANYYQQVLDMLQEQLQGEIDMNQIEEALRRYYLHVGWQLYSFDRLMGSLLRFSQAVVSNDSKDRTVDIYNLFKKDRVNESTSHKTEIAYRRAVAKFAKDADTYRIAYDTQKKEAYVRLFKKHDPTYEFTMLDRVRRWRAYSAAFYQNETTEGVDITKVELPFSKRSYNTARETADEEYNMPDDAFGRTIIQINPVTYTIRFISSEPYGAGGVEHVVHSYKMRSGLVDEAVKSAEDFTALKEYRRERAQELLVRNTDWMKDVSRDDVDARKAVFKKCLEQPEAVDGADMDVEMAEA